MAGYSIPEAMSIDATRRAASYRSEVPLANPPECLNWTREDWDTLAPGSKMAIERDLRRRGLIDDLCSPPPAKQTIKDRKASVEYASRKRL